METYGDSQGENEAILENLRKHHDFMARLRREYDDWQAQRFEWSDDAWRALGAAVFELNTLTDKAAQEASAQFSKDLAALRGEQKSLDEWYQALSEPADSERARYTAQVAALSERRRHMEQMQSEWRERRIAEVRRALRDKYLAAGYPDVATLIESGEAVYMYYGPINPYGTHTDPLDARLRAIENQLKMLNEHKIRDR